MALKPSGTFHHSGSNRLSSIHSSSKSKNAFIHHYQDKYSDKSILKHSKFHSCNESYPKPSKYTFSSQPLLL